MIKIRVKLGKNQFLPNFGINWYDWYKWYGKYLIFTQNYPVLPNFTQKYPKIINIMRNVFFFNIFYVYFILTKILVWVKILSYVLHFKIGIFFNILCIFENFTRLSSWYAVWFKRGAKICIQFWAKIIKVLYVITITRVFNINYQSFYINY